MLSSKEDFFGSFEPAVDALIENVEKSNVIRIVTHSDADGVAAGGILSQLVKRLGARFKTSCEKRIDEKTVSAISSENPSLVLFSDMGSSYLDTLNDHLKGPEIIVLDHHAPVSIGDSNIIHVNPLLHDLDGGKGISGAGVCYLFARKVDERNLDLSILGVIGALADQQDKGDKKTFLGLNKIIESDAKECKLLETSIDLVFYGYETRPIARAISYTMNPFIPGLSGREDKCLALLKETGIELKREGKWRALRDLTKEEKRNLFSAISKHMIYEGCDASLSHSLVGTIYTLTKEEKWTPLRDGREHASLLNASARIGKPGLGLSICVGDRREALKEAEKTLDEYRKKIGLYLDFVRHENLIEEKDSIYYLRGQDYIDDRIIGVIASILLNSSILKTLKPIIAVAYMDEGLIKVSARATESMGEKGLDLGRVMMRGAEIFSGKGGGHDIAAGAFIPLENEMDFIEWVDKNIFEQL